MRIVASVETVGLIRQSGGLLFVWATRSLGPRLALTTLTASLDPPPNAFDFARQEINGFTLFVHPNLDPPPEELWIDFQGRRRLHPCAYWNGLAFRP